MKRRFPKLNRYAYTFEDVRRIIRLERIHLEICEYSDDIFGYYCTRTTPKRVKKYIVINSMLGEVERTFVGLHELGHHFLHIPISARQWLFCRRNAALTYSKHECEADVFALVAMIPLPLLLDLASTNFADVPPGMIDYCLRRQKIYETKGF